MLTRDASALEKHTKIEGLWAETLSVLASHGVEYVVYISVAADFSSPFVLTNSPEIYSGAPPQNDPFLHHCCESYDITNTGAQFLDQHDYLPEKAKAFIQAAAKVGFTTGLGIPMRLQGSTRFGGFNLGTGMTRAVFEKTIWPRREEFRTFCLIVHRRLEELMSDVPERQSDFRDLLIAPPDARLIDLSPREREIIYLITKGLSRKECARICGISPNTVAEYTKNAYRKLGVQNRGEAAEKLSYL